MVDPFTEMEIRAPTEGVIQKLCFIRFRFDSTLKDPSGDDKYNEVTRWEARQRGQN